MSHSFQFSWLGMTLLFGEGNSHLRLECFLDIIISRNKMDVHQRETPCVVEGKELIEQQNMNSDGACIPMTIRLHAVSTTLGDMHVV